MKHKTWFRLVLKAIGVLLVGLALPDVTTLILMIADHLFHWSQMTGGGAAPLASRFRTSTVVLQSLPYLVQAAFGLYLFFGGTWVVNKVIPSNKPYCPDCGYDLSRRTTDRCPECGVALANESGARS
jgi:hypothetical protein